MFKCFYLSVKYIVVLFLASCALLAQANIVLQGSMNVGDNNNNALNPNYLLDENILGVKFTPKNPIHFTLTDEFRLKQIKLQYASGIGASLYFVIWDSTGQQIVRERSEWRNYLISDNFNINLPASDYTIAIVGQCFVGGVAVGWYDNCSDNDDFNFTNIELIGVGESNSLSFITRSHIGDSPENDGYGGRWYPDTPTSNIAEYVFTPSKNVKLLSATVYNYRDLLANSSGVELRLDENTDHYDGYLNSTRMTLPNVAGDFSWSLDESLVAGQAYRLKIETEDNNVGYDADDISWDDIVLTFEAHTSAVNHYRIIHSDTALTCESASVTVQACSNDAADGRCDIADVDEDVQLTIDNSNNNTVALENGIGVLNIERLTASIVELSFQGSTDTYCNAATSTTNQTTCDINFTDLGLQFSTTTPSYTAIGNQVAGIDIDALYLRALESNGNGTCSVLTLPHNSFKLGLECVEPAVCDNALDFKVSGTQLNNRGGKTAILLPKVVDGIYQLPQAVYDNAGLIRLSASYLFANDVEAQTLEADSEFAVRPYRFKIKATRHEGLNGEIWTDLTEQDSSGLKHTHKAGDIFSFKIQALNANTAEDTVTSNYIPNSNDKLRIKLTRSMPTTGTFEGEFSYASNKTLATSTSAAWVKMPDLPSFDKGVYHFTDSTYNEVGAIQINVKDKDYYGMRFMVNDTFDNDALGTEIGRFIPDHFELVSSSVINYLDENNYNYDYAFPIGLASYIAGTTVLQAKDGNVYQCREHPYSGFCMQWNTGSDHYEPGFGSDWQDAWILLSTTEPGAIFTYMDQPELLFDYQLEAQNSFGIVTRNYAGDDKAKVSFIANADGLDFSNRLVDFGGVWCDGIYKPSPCELDIIDEGYFARKPTGPDGPIMNTLFGISITDADGVVLNNLDLPATPAVATARQLSAQKSELRYGRWNITDNFGPIDLPLPTSMSLEYYDGIRFIANADDNLTTFTHTLAKASMIGSTQPLLVGSGEFDNGVTQELLISSKVTGDSVLEYNAPLWLEFDWSANGDDSDDPSALVNFGFFRGNDQTIYRRRLN